MWDGRANAGATEEVAPFVSTGDEDDAGADRVAVIGYMSGDRVIIDQNFLNVVRIAGRNVADEDFVVVCRSVQLVSRGGTEKQQGCGQEEKSF